LIESIKMKIKHIEKKRKKEIKGEKYNITKG